MHYQRWQHAGELGLPSARDRAELLHLPETDKAYIAAFLDGEGTIGMRRTRRPGGQPPVGTSARARRLPLHQGRQPRRPLLPARAPRAVRPAGGPVSGPTRLPLLVRTGSAAFSTAMLARWKRAQGIGREQPGSVDGRLVTRDSRAVPTPDEETIFRLVGMRPLPPEHRTGEAW